jgi:hypothetical protein
MLTPASVVPLMNAQKEYSYIKHTSSINLHAYVTPKPLSLYCYDAYRAATFIAAAYLQLLPLVNDITSLLLSHCCVFTACIQRRINPGTLKESIHACSKYSWAWFRCILKVEIFFLFITSIFELMYEVVNVDKKTTNYTVQLEIIR